MCRFGLVIGLSRNPVLGAFRAFGDVQKVGMGKAAGVVPIALAVLVGAGEVDGIEAVILPDGGGDQAKPELEGGLV